MASNFLLHGSMVPRAVTRQVDHRSEPRIDAGSKTAVLELRGREHVVRLVNLSRSGAMVIFSLIPIIGEPISIRLGDRGRVGGYVCWVRDGRIGITFDVPQE